MSIWINEEEENIKNSITNYISIYEKDVTYIKSKNVNILNIRKLFNVKLLIEVFLNLYTALKIYNYIKYESVLSERAFSKLWKIKNKFRTNGTPENLTGFMILVSKNYILVNQFKII